MSLRLRLMRGLMRRGVKPLFARVRHAGLARVGLAVAAVLVPLPRAVKMWRARAAALPLLWFDAGAPDLPVLVWFHGGAYVAGSGWTHRGLLGRIARAARIRVAAPDYRLAPEHPFPAAFEDGLAVISALKLPAGQVILGGDSAGGGLAAALAAHLCAQGKAPRGLILLSPWADLTLSGPSLARNARRDPLLPAQAMPAVVELIRGQTDASDPRLSPVFARWTGAPATLIQVGSTEILLDDSLRLAEALRAAGAAVSVERQPGAPHVLAWLAPWVPESTAAVGGIARFIRGLSDRKPGGS